MSCCAEDGLRIGSAMPVGRDPIANGRRLRWEQFSVACRDLGLRDAFAFGLVVNDTAATTAVLPKTCRCRQTAA